MSISEMVRIRRLELGLSQDELASRLGYKSRSSINKIEQGKNDIPQSKIVQLAKALNCSPAYLMGWEENTQDKTHTLTDTETALLSNYRKLNPIGKAKADEYITDLSYNPKYTALDGDKQK